MPMFFLHASRQMLDSPCLDELPDMLVHFKKVQDNEQRKHVVPKEYTLLKNLAEYDYSKNATVDFGDLNLKRQNLYEKQALYRQFEMRWVEKGIEKSSA